MTIDFFGDAQRAVSSDLFEERPVDLKTFVESPEYLSYKATLRPSEMQYKIISAMTEIYHEDALIQLYGEDEGSRRWKERYLECYLCLGKGSGKDWSSTIAIAYMVYLVLCLKDPQGYYSSDSIDIINIATNADQANRVFFKNFMDRINKSKWFQGKYDERAGHVSFGKGVFVYSGNSEREAFEGYNTLAIILDEISGFAMESTTGNSKAKTSDEIYKWARGSVDSRFAEVGKVVLLSFPRHEEDYMLLKYNENVKEKETFIRKKTLRVDVELPWGTPGNEFDVEWEEDHVIRTDLPNTFCLKRPSWEVNPNKDLQKDYARAFYKNYNDALKRFACMPSDSVDDKFIKDRDRMNAAFSGINMVDQNGFFHPQWRPKENTKYYMHVDLSKVHDRCAVAVSHVEKWVASGEGLAREIYPYVVVDAIRYWEPSKEEPMDYQAVVDFILKVKNYGFDLGLVSFDVWQSHDTMGILNNYHVKAEKLSVGNEEYNDFLATMYNARLEGPDEELLKEELKELMFVKGKVDHPRSGYKDISDAVCGSIRNAVKFTKKPSGITDDIETLADLLARQRKEEAQFKPKPTIDPPKAKAPDWVKKYLQDMEDAGEDGVQWL